MGIINSVSGNEEEVCCEEWDIKQLMTLQKGNIPDYGIIVLNRPISHSSHYLVPLWRNAQVTLTTDGGTNRWDTFLQSLDEETQKLLEPPNLITGDFDSIRKETMEKYRSLGSKIVYTPNQNATDFTKAVNEMNTHCDVNNINLDSIVAITETSGRLDQIMANINTLFLYRERTKTRKLYLMTDDAVSWLVGKGQHTIIIPEELRARGAWCAMIPVGEECSRVTTTGLKWNLDNHSLKFGGIVSTSNTYDGSPTVHITCSHPLLWAMNIKPLLP